MDEQKDLSVSNEEVLDNGDSSSNDEVPNIEENADTSNISGNININKTSNGYRGMTSSNGEVFSRGFKERIARNKANRNQSRVNAANFKKGVKTNNRVESKGKSGLEKENAKGNLLNNNTELLGNKTNNSNKTNNTTTTNNKSSSKDAVKSVIKAKIRNWILVSILPISIVLVSILVVFIGVLYIFGFDSNASGGSGGSVAMGGKECGFTISDTSFSKSEFKNKIQEYANAHPQWQIFADNANDYYDYAKAKGVNPEVVVLIAYKENNGYETTQNTNNYWGWGCPNGAKRCEGLFSFMDGAKKVIDSASKWDTLINWFYIGHYSWIGDYWLNPGSSGSGGCYYAEHIYPDNMPTRVKNACAKGKECSGSACVRTDAEEDQMAYSKWLVYTKMANGRKSIFGLESNEGVSCSYKSNDIVEGYVNWMIEFAADDTRGYSQSTRYMNPNVDCSSFVYYGLLNGAGFTKDELGNSAFTTTNMIGILQKLGFKVYSYEEDKLIRGDILWKNGHTEVYIGDGKNVGAHTDYDGINGDGNGKEVNVASNYTGWTYYIRYVGNKD